MNQFRKDNETGFLNYGANVQLRHNLSSTIRFVKIQLVATRLLRFLVFTEQIASKNLKNIYSSQIPLSKFTFATAASIFSLLLKFSPLLDMDPILSFQEGNSSVAASLDIEGTHLPFIPTIITIVAFAPVVFCFLMYAKSDLFTLQNGDGNRIPSGPRGIPILGTFLRHLPLQKSYSSVLSGSFPFLTKYPELTLNRWANSFGNLYSTYLGNQLFMIISDPVVAKDLIVTNGGTFSGRKEMFIKSQIVFAGRGITASPYNDRWLVLYLRCFSLLVAEQSRRKHRRIAFTWLNQTAVNSYTPVLDKEASVLIKSLWEESKGGLVPINPQVRTDSKPSAKLLTSRRTATCRSMLSEQYAHNYLWYTYRQCP